MIAGIMKLRMQSQCLVAIHSRVRETRSLLIARPRFRPRREGEEGERGGLQTVPTLWRVGIGPLVMSLMRTRHGNQ